MIMQVVELSRNLIHFCSPILPRLALCCEICLSFCQWWRTLPSTPILAGLHGRNMLKLIVANVGKDIKEIVTWRPAQRTFLGTACLELIKIVKVSIAVVFHGNWRSRQSSKKLLVFFNEL